MKFIAVELIDGSVSKALMTVSQFTALTNAINVISTTEETSTLELITA